MKDNRDLLFTDLCARLPYGVKCFVNYSFCNETTDYEDVASSTIDNLVAFNHQNESFFFDWLNEWFEIDEFKPYLFPLSSMTEEQKKEYKQFLEDIDGYVYSIDCVPQIDWLNKHHFDYRGLIPKGLALDATGLNIY